MVFFKYLADILQHSSLSSCFHGDSQKMYSQKTANVFSLALASFYSSYGDISMNE